MGSCTQSRMTVVPLPAVTAGICPLLTSPAMEEHVTLCLLSFRNNRQCLLSQITFVYEFSPHNHHGQHVGLQLSPFYRETEVQRG